MVKRNTGILSLILILLFVMVGCDETKVYTYEDFLGEWDLPNDTHISIMQDDTDPSDKILDIRWQQGTTEYFAMVDGTANSNVFTGTYIYTQTADNGDGNLVLYYGDDYDIDLTTPLSEPPLPITITLTMFQDKPKLTCTGDTPLGGKIFSM